MIKGIIFDYDGVIVDSFENAIAAYREVFRHLGLPRPDEDDNVRVAVSGGFINCLRGLGIKDDDLKAASLIYQREIIKRHHHIFPGVEEMIKELSTKYKLFVVSASHSLELKNKLGEAGLLGYFKDVMGGADNNIRKSDLMTSLLEEYGYLPNEAVSVGDRAVDYMASIAAGIPDENIVMVSYGWGLDMSKIGKAKVVDTPQSVVKEILKLK